MSQTVIPKSTQTNADDFIAGPRTVTVTDVRRAEPASTEQPIAVHFDGDDGKPYYPCKSMRRVMIEVWGNDAKGYIGRSMTLYRDPKVKWGGMEIGGIRISHMSHMKGGEVALPLTTTNKAKAIFRVKPLVIAAPPHIDTTAAKAAASKGTAAFKAWWSTASAEDRTAATAIKGDLKALCDTADAAIADDPFGLPPLDERGPTPSEAEIAAAQAEREFAAERARENAAYTTK